MCFSHIFFILHPNRIKNINFTITERSLKIFGSFYSVVDQNSMAYLGNIFIFGGGKIEIPYYEIVIKTYFMLNE